MDGVKKTRSAPLTRAQRFFNDQLHKVDAETRKLIQSKQMSYDDKDQYVRKLINTAGGTELINTTTVKKVGVSSFDKNQLADQIYMVLEKLRLSYGTDAAIVDPANIEYSNKGQIPNALANGELVVSIDDKPVVELPAARFFNDGSTGVTSEATQGIYDAVELQCLKFITPVNSIRVDIRLAEGLTMGAGNHFLEFRFMGIGTRKR